MTSAADATAVLHALSARAADLAAEANGRRQGAEQVRFRLGSLWSTSRHPAGTDAQAAVARGVELLDVGVTRLSRVAELVNAAAGQA